MRILVVTEDNKLLYDEDTKTGRVKRDSSIEYRLNQHGLVIKLKDKYKTDSITQVKVKDWELIYNS